MAAERQSVSEAIKEFLREAASRLAENIEPRAVLSVEDEDWERDEQGHFHRTIVAKRHYFPAIHRHWPQMQTLPSYQAARDSILADPVLAPQMGQLLGPAGLGGIRLEVDDVLLSLVDAMFRDDGTIVFEEDKYEARWKEIEEVLYSEKVIQVSVAPLPGFTVPLLPIELEEGLAIDKLTDAEIKRCVRAGLLTPFAPGIPIIDPEGGVGIRWITHHEKIAFSKVQVTPPVSSGTFGRRPALQAPMLVDDIIMVLRLLKASELRCPGVVTFRRGWRLAGMLQWNTRAVSRPSFGSCLLDEKDVSLLTSLWRTLKGGLLEKARFRFLGTALRRLNYSFDRSLPEDRLVDLLIGAESLFLHDATEPAERGELRFRLALRGAMFVAHPAYSRRQVYQVLSRAYAARSAIVHGGEARKTALPDAPDADLRRFVAAVEEILRLGLRRGIFLSARGEAGFGTADYWERLLFEDSMSGDGSHSDRSG